MSKNIKLTSRRLRSIIESVVKEQATESDSMLVFNLVVTVDATDLISEHGLEAATRDVKNLIQDNLAEIEDLLQSNVSWVGEDSEFEEQIPVAVRSVTIKLSS